MSFYSNFLKLCSKKNVSPSCAASAIGLSNAAASGWKKGKVPQDTTLQKLAEYFGVTVAELMAENEKASASRKSGLINKDDIKKMTHEELLENIMNMTLQLQELDKGGL